MSTQALGSIKELSDKTKELFLSALQQGVVPATGCTEPISIAYAAAVCMSYLESEQPSKHKAGCGAADKIESLTIKVSPNIMKNALAVIVPGTSEPGLVIAAAAGALVGLAQEGLGVISKLEACELAQIKEFASSGKITAELAAVEDDLYVEAVLIDKQGNKVECYIASEHTHIFKLVRNACSLIEKERPAPHAISPIKQALQDCSFKEVWNFAHQIELEKISFIDTAADLNMELAKIGLEQNFGLGLGRSIRQANNINFGGGMDADLCTKLIAYTSAASDARMGGALLPAMSNSGSGNQGITATVPVCVLAQELKLEGEKLTRALALSHLTALYIHAFLPVLSAFCAADSAAMGAAVGCCYLEGASYEKACAAIKNMAGDVAGMVCDGAGCACAMKVASSVSSMYRAVNLALQGIEIPSSNGMVCPCVDQTIRGIGKLGTIGLKDTDETIISIMTSKS